MDFFTKIPVMDRTALRELKKGIDLSFKDPDQWIKLASEKHTSGNQRRMANKLLEDFRTQMLGKICLEVPSEY